MTRNTMSSQPISVPHGPDRQRVLNVLAQRRYRKSLIHITSPISYSLCVGQRKRERLQSLQVRLDARLSETNATNASGGQMQLQHPMQPSLLEPVNFVTPNDPLYHPYSAFMIEASNTSFMCPAPNDAACNNTSESLSSYVTDQFGVDNLLSYGMP